MAGEAFLILPAPDRIRQAFSGIVRKEIPDIRIVLKLRPDDRFPFLLLPENVSVC